MSFTHDVVAIIDEYEQSQKFFAGWARIKLGTIATIINGYPFDSNFFSDREGIPLIRIRDILASHTKTKFFGEAPRGYEVRFGDIVIGMDGDFNLGVWTGPEALLNQRVCKVVPSEMINDRYLVRILPIYLRLVNDKTSSTTVKHLSSKTLQDLPLPLPPLPEQERIAARLDLLLGKLKAARKQLDAVPELLKRFRKSVLAMAVSGRLTEEWRAEHEAELPSAEELLAQVRKERREAWEKAELEKMRAKGKIPRGEGWKGSYVEPTSVEVDKTAILPASWISISWDQVGYLKNGYAYKSDDYVDAGVPLIRISDLDGYGCTTNHAVQIPSLKVVDGFEVNKGDLLIAMSGATTGKIGVFIDDIHATQNQRVGNIKIYSRNVIELKYRNIIFLFESESILKRAYGGAQPNISGAEVEATKIALPALLEQHEIVRRVDELFAFVDALEARVAVARKMAERLEPSILAKAFRGELSEQIPEEAAAWEKTLAELEAAAGALGEKIAKRGRKPQAQVEKGAGMTMSEETDTQPLKRKRGRPRKVP